MEVKWSLLAQIDYWSNIEYLEEEWSEKDVLAFIDNVDYTVQLLQKNNIVFSKTQYKSVFKVLVVKQISLYYSIEETTITLLRFWNNYKDLSEFKLH